ncbi:MAG: hypothetical protein A4E48_00251 [Methanosaeta sp. PtaU1.Bin060]|nr:MAG: hypothetical protein A4E48_00251 [Methanosaeta sp. PtaU1.Bin060]
MKPRSCKAKGRRLQNALAADLQKMLGLAEADVKPSVMGEQGMDLKLSSAARSRFPFAVEAKNCEALSIWRSLEQAEKNAKAEGLKPLLAFKRNGSKIYVAMAWNDFLELCSML